MQMADDLRLKAGLHRNRFCARVEALLRVTVAPSGFPPLPARGRKCGEGQPAPFPAPFLSCATDLPSTQTLDAIDLQAMRDVEGTGRGSSINPP